MESHSDIEKHSLGFIYIQNLYILDLTAETKDIFNDDAVFVSYKMESNIKSLICKNKYTRELQIDSNAFTSCSHSIDMVHDVGPKDDCCKCNNCSLCRNNIAEVKTLSSPKTRQNF